MPSIRRDRDSSIVSGSHVDSPEVIEEDLGRPDLEGQDEASRSVVVVESKFGADLSAAQMLESFKGY